jgi:hypothetical protein
MTLLRFAILATLGCIVFWALMIYALVRHLPSACA